MICPTMLTLAEKMENFILLFSMDRYLKNLFHSKKEKLYTEPILLQIKQKVHLIIMEKIILLNTLFGIAICFFRGQILKANISPLPYLLIKPTL